eukprot:TRINITY_DN2530_c0_g1_i1.p1 TRINITY_DN2530_c0_g1~~TRINITY_DN2530_c0_g1_i1.p1  ORF type:complete len:323 (+),score=95.54 TRINITY_DN2530_c0_g1_i1:107-1075(+)
MKRFGRRSSVEKTVEKVFVPETGLKPGSFSVGDSVEIQRTDGAWYPAVISRIHGTGDAVFVRYELDGSNCVKKYLINSDKIAAAGNFIRSEEAAAAAPLQKIVSNSEEQEDKAAVEATDEPSRKAKAIEAAKLAAEKVKHKSSKAVSAAGRKGAKALSKLKSLRKIDTPKDNVQAADQEEPSSQHQQESLATPMSEQPHDLSGPVVDIDDDENPFEEAKEAVVDVPITPVGNQSTAAATSGGLEELLETSPRSMSAVGGRTSFLEQSQELEKKSEIVGITRNASSDKKHNAKEMLQSAKSKLGNKWQTMRNIHSKSTQKNEA